MQLDIAVITSNDEARAEVNIIKGGERLVSEKLF